MYTHEAYKKNAKAVPISLAEVPTLHQVAVDRYLGSWWR